MPLRDKAYEIFVQNFKRRIPRITNPNFNYYIGMVKQKVSFSEACVSTGSLESKQVSAEEEKLFSIEENGLPTKSLKILMKDAFHPSTTIEFP